MGFIRIPAPLTPKLLWRIVMTTQYYSNNFEITIDYTRDTILSEAGVAIMKDRYLLPTEKSPQECFARAACAFASNQRHAQRLYDYASRNWFMFATPILSNAGCPRGLPISCFLGQVDDSIQGILEHHYENGFLASYGGGSAGDWSKLRSSGSNTSRGNKSTGVIAFVKMMDSQMMAFQQGSTRRGSYAAYMDVSHPEIKEFINIRTGQGADIARRCLGEGFHHGVNIPDAFMLAVKNGGTWNLVDPHSKEAKETVDARTLWMEILIKRLETGEPYLHFIDTSNAALPKFLKDKGLRINNSNLCSEIMLPTSPERTAVCCLSSVNFEYFSEWQKDDQFIHDIAEMLDNVLGYFIAKAPEGMAKAVKSAMNERSIGIGAMGFHLYLQKNQIPLETAAAVSTTRRLFQHVRQKCDNANKFLSVTRGEAPDAKGENKRFSHVMAIAPNANISMICGNTSPSCEPYNANGFTQKTMSGSFLIKNKELDKVLQKGYGKKGDELEEIWSSIIVNGGSVQHLSFMADLHKEVFKTAMEIDQNWIVELAKHRQEFIDQGQSVNLFLPSNIHKQDLHTIHYNAWRGGLKSLYYLRSIPIEKTKVISKPLWDPDKECIACT